MSDDMSLDLPNEYPFKGPTTASCLIQALGLSQTDAAVFFSVRRDTIKKWQSGKMNMPEVLLERGFERLSLLMKLAAEIAQDYVEHAHNESIYVAYIGLPTTEQMRRGMLPSSKGFYETFFGMIMAHAQSGDDSKGGLTMAICEPSEDLDSTNMWLPRLLAEDIDWFCISMVDEDDLCVRADPDFYAFLREQLKALKFTAKGKTEQNLEWASGGPFIDIPYLPYWLHEAHPELSEPELELLDTHIRLRIPGYAKTTDQLRGDNEATIFFVGPDGIIPVFDATEGPEDADMNALNAALAQIIDDVFGSMEALWLTVQKQV